MDPTRDLQIVLAVLQVIATCRNSRSKNSIYDHAIFDAGDTAFADHLLTTLGTGATWNCISEVLLSPASNE